MSIWVVGCLAGMEALGVQDDIEPASRSTMFPLRSELAMTLTESASSIWAPSGNGRFNGRWPPAGGIRGLLGQHSGRTILILRVFASNFRLLG